MTGVCPLKFIFGRAGGEFALGNRKLKPLLVMPASHIPYLNAVSLKIYFLFGRQSYRKNKQRQKYLVPETTFIKAYKL